jgi:isoleucyl-tRNA synthetase
MQAYETLNFVLIELSKIIAPFMPFVSEYIYKELTKKESVHLDFYPDFDENSIDENLNKDMEITRNIITL